MNTGLSGALAPGTPAGLTDDTTTLAMTLKQHGNYRTAMAGKWHLGHAQRKQTPIGKGFDSFVGMRCFKINFCWHSHYNIYCCNIRNVHVG